MREAHRKLVALGNVRGELVALLGHHGLGGAAREARVGELRLAARDLGLELAELLLEASELLGFVDHGGHLEVAAVVDKAEELARLEQQLGKLEAEITRGEAKLANAGFTGCAPEAVVAKERDKLAAYVAERDELAVRLAHLRGA